MIKELNEIVSVLTPQEKGTLRKHFEAQPENGRRFELYRLIEEGLAKDDEDAAWKLYKWGPQSAYSHLKARLCQTIFQVLFPHPNPEFPDPHARARYAFQRHLLIAQFFIGRYAFLTARRNLTEARKIAIELSLPIGQMMVDEYLERYCRREFVPLQCPPPIGRNGILPNGKPLPVLAQFRRSRRQIYDAKKEKFTLEELQAVQLDRIRNAFSQGELAAANAGLDRVLNVIPARSRIKLAALETGFHMAAAQENTDLLSRLCAEALAHPLVSESPFHASLWNYYHAHAELLKGQTGPCLQLLQQCPELHKYKSKWLIGLKTLEVYAFIFQEQYDLVEYKINALKQLLKRQKGCGLLRAKFICRVLTALVRMDFDCEMGIEYLDKTKADPKVPIAATQWQAFGYEVIQLRQFLEMGIRVKQAGS